MDQFTAMRAFARVVEAGTFSRAADTLGIPKPTVTKLIQMLEARVRAKLLNRTTRRVTVTPDGAAYYERVVQILGDIDELDSSMSSSQASPKGRLRVDVSTSIALRVIIPALQDFHARYPDIQLDLGASDRPADLVGDNVDCVLRAGTLSDPSLIARRIADMRFITCAAPSYIARYGVPEHPRDLQENHFGVGYFFAGPARSFAFEFKRGDETLEITPRYIISTNDSVPHVAAGVAGLGVIQSATFMLSTYLASGELQPVLTAWPRDPMPLYVVYPPNKHLSAKLRVFIDWVAGLFIGADFGRQS
jgi:LysR family transcriptional regulator for bpeEF and oprC